MDKKKGIALNIKNTAIRFAKEIINKGISVNRLIIFGSYAKGKANKNSDIDLCVVSSDFGKDPISELQFLLKRTRDIDDRIEPLPISLREYKECATPIIYEIKKFGKEVVFS